MRAGDCPSITCGFIFSFTLPVFFSTHELCLLPALLILCPIPLQEGSEQAGGGRLGAGQGQPTHNTVQTEEDKHMLSPLFSDSVWKGDTALSHHLTSISTLHLAICRALNKSKQVWKA